MIQFTHKPGYSKVDHAAPELIHMAEQEMEGRPQTVRSGEAALRRAIRRAHRLAKEQPATFGLFRFSLPAIAVEKK